MERFKKYQALVSRMSDTDWLIDCAAMPHDHIKQADIEQIMLEVTRRIWDGKIPVPNYKLL